MIELQTGSIMVNHYCLSYLTWTSVCDSDLYVSNYTKNEFQDSLQTIFVYSVVFLLIWYFIIKLLFGLFSSLFHR